MDSGLCGQCRHARVLDTGRSRFYLCGLSQREPHRYPRYPRLPVLRCGGYQAT